MNTLRLITLTAVTVGLVSGSSLATVTGPVEVESENPVIVGTVGLPGLGSPGGFVRTSIVSEDDVDFSGWAPQPPEPRVSGGGKRLAR